jgi:Ca2+-binding EF-hand superfamily protein
LPRGVVSAEAALFQATPQDAAADLVEELIESLAQVGVVEVGFAEFVIALDPVLEFAGVIEPYRRSFRIFL